MFVTRHPCLLESRDQVEKRIKKDPDNIDKVPVESRILQRRKPAGMDLPLQDESRHDSEEANPCQDVEAVKACHHIVKAKEEDLASLPIQKGRRIRIDAVLDFGAPFDAFVEEKENTEEDRRD
jgi:hypothetical protein